jgi:signal transduction histidine kinase
LATYAGQARLSLAPTNLAALLTEVASEIKPGLNPRSELRCLWTAETLPPVEADQAQLHQAIVSALRNACQALPSEGGVVALVAGTVDADREYLAKFRPATKLQPGTYAFIEVVDNGCGMNDETLAQIFDPFFSTKKAQSGMGMSSLLGIVRGHRGAVNVESAVGHGTTLRMLLPVASDSRELAARLQRFLGD